MPGGSVVSTKKPAKDVYIEYLALADLQQRRREDNPKGHDGELLRSLFQRAGYVDPVVIDERDGRIGAGHGRIDELTDMRDSGAEAPERIKVVRGEWFVPTLRGVRFRDADVAMDYLIGSNQAPIAGGWENGALARILAQYEPERLAMIGFTPDDVVLFAKLGRGEDDAGGGSDPDAEGVPDLPRVPVTKAGDLWQLGDHRLLCAETCDGAAISRLLREATPTLIHADPPYGMGKEKDGVENDNLYDKKLDAFQMKWFHAWVEHLSLVGSIYIWGNAPDLWRLWWRHLEPLSNDADRLVFRNEIVWDKGSGFGMRSEGAHSYSPATERCLFFMRGQQFLGNQNKADFWEGYEPLRAWLEGQRKEAGWSNTDVNRMTGTSMAGHWFGQSQFMPISREHYDKLRAEADGRAFVEEYDALFGRLFPGAKAGGNQHRRDLAAQLRDRRSFFDNTHDAMTDVWQFPRVAGEERFGHATPKPVAMALRAIRSSSDVGDVVAVPFVGTGPEYPAAEQAGRRVVGIDNSPAYCDVVIERWEKLTGKKAKRVRT
jgi:DNA modification methylase